MVPGKTCPWTYSFNRCSSPSASCFYSPKFPSNWIEGNICFHPFHGQRASWMQRLPRRADFGGRLGMRCSLSRPVAVQARSPVTSPFPLTQGPPQCAPAVRQQPAPLPAEPPERRRHWGVRFGADQVHRGGGHPQVRPDVQTLPRGKGRRRTRKQHRLWLRKVLPRVPTWHPAHLQNTQRAQACAGGVDAHSPSSLLMQSSDNEKINWLRFYWVVTAHHRSPHTHLHAELMDAVEIQLSAFWLCDFHLVRLELFAFKLSS